MIWALPMSCKNANDSGRSRMRLLQNHIGRSSSKTGLISITLQILQHNTKDWVLAVLSNKALTWQACEPHSFMRMQGLQHFGSQSTKHKAQSTKHKAQFCDKSGCASTLRSRSAFFLVQWYAMLKELVAAIYQAHPYEEPVMFSQPCLRTLHIRRHDIANLNRF